MISNPYAAPGTLPHKPHSRVPVRFLAAVGLLASSVGFVIFYMFISLHLIPRGQPTPVWPPIGVPFVLSIWSAVRTRSIAISPLTCLLGVSCIPLVFGILRGWAGADAHVVVPIGVALSAPPLFIIIYLNRRDISKASLHSADERTL